MTTIITTQKRGPKSTLTPEILMKIKSCILEGGNMKEIAKYIDVSENTVNCWYYCNTQGLKEKVQMWRIDKMLIDAEKVSSEILGYCPLKSDGTVDASILAVQQRESAFLREKLVIARDTYNTKSVNIVNVIPPVPILGNIFREA